MNPLGGGTRWKRVGGSGHSVRFALFPPPKGFNATCSVVVLDFVRGPRICVFAADLDCDYCSRRYRRFQSGAMVVLGRGPES